MKPKLSQNGNVLLVLGNVLFVCFLIGLFYFRPFGLDIWVERYENLFYDLSLRYIDRPTLKHSSIRIVDIDDKSVRAEGGWPWSRIKLSELLKTLYAAGARVVVFDMVFNAPEINPVVEVIKGGGGEELERLEPQFAGDTILTNELQKGKTILGFRLTQKGDPEGVLPAPYFLLSEKEARKSAIFNRKSYIGNLPSLQQAAIDGGFINMVPDTDGVIRYIPLLLRLDTKVYATLALQAAAHFLSLGPPVLLMGQYGGDPVIRGVLLGKREILTDEWAHMLIPFWGPAGTFPYLSATDVLNERIPPDALKDKLVFIGSSAINSETLMSTAIGSNFPRVEIAANIAQAIIDSHFLVDPPWGRIMSISLLVFVGFLSAIILPWLSPARAVMWTLGWIGAQIGSGYFLWREWGIYISFTFPLFCLGALFVIDIAYGFLFEQRKRFELKRIFGQYVPPEYVERVTKENEDVNFSGETKEMSVLFADIRNFTGIAEQLSANELKDLLTLYLTPMTRIIFEHKGVVDKYVGDLIMAFWGAPIDDPQHALHAVQAALAMQESLRNLNKELQEKGRPELKIGIGVNTGMMNVGDTGSKFRKAYTVIGDSVNLASRLESLTKYYTVDILVGEETWRQTQKEFFYRKIDRVKVKGKEIGQELYQPFELLKEAELMTQVQEYEQALESYFSGQWEKAEQFFLALQKKYPNEEKLYSVFLGRINQFKFSPPAGWDGTYFFELK